MSLSRILYRTWRVLRWVLLTLLALVLAGIAAFWWANRHDDPLRPEVAQALRFDPPAVEAMRRNGYFIMLGLDAPPSEDPFTAGQQFFAAQMRDYEQYLRTGMIESPADTGGARQPVRLAATACGADVDNCYTHYLKHAQAIRALLTRHEAVVQRYLALLDAPVYEEVIPQTVLTNLGNHYQNEMAVSELVDMRAALLLHDGQTSQAWTLLAKNARLHQRLMDGAGGVIGAMVALAADFRQQRLISGMLRAQPMLAASGLERLQALVKTPSASAMSHATKEEMRVYLNTHYVLAKIGASKDDGLARGFQSFLNRSALNISYLPNATMNQTYADWQALGKLASLPADQLDATAAQLDAARRDAIGTDGGFLSELRNPIGKTLFEISSLKSQMSYIERAHDVEGYRRLLRLQIAALHEGVQSAQMTGWLAARPPELRNPYTLQPMGWDAATRSLVFEGRQPQSQNPQRSNIYRVRLAP